MRSIGQRYYRATREPTASLTCPYQGDLQAVYDGTPSGSTLDALWALRNPACNRFWAEEMAEQKMAGYRNAVSADFYRNLNYGQGFLPVTTINAEGDTIVMTPSSVVKSMNQMFLESGYRQNEAANNVNEMVSGLFANIATHIISNPQGIRSLLQPYGSSGSLYIDRVVQQAANGITQSTGNAALQILNAALTIEQAYNQIVSAIANLFTQTIGQLRAAEQQCWASLIQNICTTGTYATSTASCMSTSGDALTRIATSTQFSQAVIDNQIQPLASSTLANITRSNAAITILNEIIATVSGNPTAAAQSAAIARYNTLLSAGAFHTETDVANAQNQRTAVTTAMTTLVQNTVSIWTGTDANGSPTIPWDGTINPGTGWCNYQNTATKALWIARWK